MTAARTAAARSAASNVGAYPCTSRRITSSPPAIDWSLAAFGGRQARRRGRSPDVPRASSFAAIAGTSVARFATTPRKTDGSQIAIMQIGYSTIVFRKWPSRFAVMQKIAMCGNAIDDSGMNV